MTDPATIINPPKQPLLSVRRVVIAAILLAAVVVLVVTQQGGEDADGGGTACGSNPAVVAWDPCPGARVLRQAQIGVELEPGYDGRISVNGIEVPEVQMQGAIVPGTDAYEELSAEDRARGPRPNTKHVVKFQPGEGKVVEEFSGQVRVGIRLWKESEGEETAQNLSYTVFVT